MRIECLDYAVTSNILSILPSPQNTNKDILVLMEIPFFFFFYFASEIFFLAKNDWNLEKLCSKEYCFFFTTLFKLLLLTRRTL